MTSHITCDFLGKNFFYHNMDTMITILNLQQLFQNRISIYYVCLHDDNLV